MTLDTKNKRPVLTLASGGSKGQLPTHSLTPILSLPPAPQCTDFFAFRSTQAHSHGCHPPRLQHCCLRWTLHFIQDFALFFKSHSIRPEHPIEKRRYATIFSLFTLFFFPFLFMLLFYSLEIYYKLMYCVLYSFFPTQDWKYHENTEFVCFLNDWFLHFEECGAHGRHLVNVYQTKKIGKLSIQTRVSFHPNSFAQNHFCILLLIDL